MPTRSRRLSTLINPELPAQREQPRVQSPRALLTLNFHQTPLQGRCPPGTRCDCTTEPPQGAPRPRGGRRHQGRELPARLGSVLRAMGARPFPWQRLPGTAAAPTNPSSPPATRGPSAPAPAPRGYRRRLTEPRPLLARPGCSKRPVPSARRQNGGSQQPPGSAQQLGAGGERRPPADGGTQWWQVGGQRINPAPQRFPRLSSPPARATAFKHTGAERAEVTSPQDGQQDFAVRC